MEKQQKPTEKEKLAILKEAELHGVTATLNKYGIYPATFYYWKRKVSEAGNEGLKHGMTKERLQEINRLKRENDLLKKIIAEKELESKLKDELLAKNDSSLEERKAILSSYILQGIFVGTALRPCGINKHQYYHKTKIGKSGVKCKIHFN